MKDQTEAKVAWILWELFIEFSNLLWDRYEEQFLEFILNEQYPTKKAPKTTEKFITGQVDDEMPF